MDHLDKEPAATVGMAQRAFAVCSYPGFEPRLVRCDGQRETLSEYRACGGYAQGRSGRALIAAVEASGLRGRGGAAFPAGVKLRAVAEGDAPRFVVANGEEGEPASVKDRWLLRLRPHLVIDGLDRVAEAVGAERSYIYVSDTKAAASVRAALAELGPGGTTPRELVVTRPRYVAGEETAVIRAINGGPALPLAKPPRPFEAGVDGHPTLVANVETLANVPLIARHGPDEFRTLGTAQSPGSFLLTVSGACERPGLYEVPFGVSIGDAIDVLAAPKGETIGFLMGGFFAGLIGIRGREVRLLPDDLRDIGSGLGCGAIIVLNADDCPVAAALDVMEYFAEQNAKQCGACIRGTSAMCDVLRNLAAGEGDQAGLERLRGWATSLRGRGACGLLDGAAAVAGSLFREFPSVVASHLEEPCSLCARLTVDTSASSRFAISLRGGFQ